MNIGLEIKRKRLYRKLTQCALSQKSGVNYNALIKIEGQKIKNPRTEILEKIAKVLNCNIGNIANATATTTRTESLSESMLNYDEISRLVKSIGG